MNPTIYTIGRGNMPWNFHSAGNDIPKILYVRHDGSDGMIFDESPRKIYVAIIGTRDPSPQVEKDVMILINTLYERYGKDLVTVSGLAIGTDTFVHRYSLQKGVPTIAVIGNGVGDRTYPSKNAALAEQIANTRGCAIVSEYPDGTAPQALNFIRRNRIIAAISDVVVVMQSKAKGGSLVTARIAYDIDRKVFAYPGRPDDPMHAGCNTLIKDGVAQIVTDPMDVAI